ncbi:hypothetical protein NL676_020811 [Syzygium grande]|nr:hypothetical protein NL676_020811 [Syzygium grande]
MDKIRKAEVIDIAKHVAAIEQKRSEMNDFYKSRREAIKKEMRIFRLGFAVYINGIFVVAAIAESFLEVHGPSPKKRRTDGNPVPVHGTG